MIDVRTTADLVRFSRGKPVKRVSRFFLFDFSFEGAKHAQSQTMPVGDRTKLKSALLFSIDSHVTYQPYRQFKQYIQFNAELLTGVPT